MSCAAGLARHPDKFKVTIIEREPVTGGQATSVAVDREKYGAEWMNDGVQGGSPIFSHTFHFFRALGHEPHECDLQVSFGKGENFWTNVFPSPLVSRYSKDINKFGKVLKIVRFFEVVFALVPVRILLRLFMFSKGFGDDMVYPLMALFLGTGNQTANVSSAILERLFTDDNMRLWNYSPETLLPNLPKMYTFPKLGEFYSDWAEVLRKKGVEIRLSHELVTVLKRDASGVTIQSRKVSGGKGDPPSKLVTEKYDELVMAVLADDAKNLLGSNGRWLEKKVLGSASFFDDVTVTHNDAEYFQKLYQTDFDMKLVAEEESSEQSEQSEQIDFAKDNFAKDNFAPMYYTHTYPEDPQKIEMSFDVSNYQHQFPKGKSNPIDKHVFQSIFLDKNNEKLWTKNQIKEDKILLTKWWHQLGHRWQHYINVVPCMMFLNGKKHTWFAGSWTLVVCHTFLHC